MLEVGLKGRDAVKSDRVRRVCAFQPLPRGRRWPSSTSRLEPAARRGWRRISHLLASSPGPFNTASFAVMSKDHHDGPDNSLWRTGNRV